MLPKKTRAHLRVVAPRGVTFADVRIFLPFAVGDGNRRMKGAWDSIHVFEVQEKGRNAHYQLTSTVMLYMVTNKPELGHMNLSGSMMRQVCQYTLQNKMDPGSNICYESSRFAWRHPMH